MDERTGHIALAAKRDYAWLGDMALIALLGALVNLPFLGQVDLFQSREIRHAGIAAEMAADGDFLVPHLLGQPYIYKQPVMHVPTALLFRLFGGPSIGLARSTSALVGILGAMLLYVLAFILYGQSTARWAGVLLLATPAWVMLSRTARPDMVFSVALLAMVVGLYGGMASSRLFGRVGCFMGAGLAGGLAFLAKGPYGIFYPVVFTGALAMLACLGRPSLRAPRFFEWLIFGLGIFWVPSAWALMVYARDGSGYLQMILQQHNAGTSAHERPVFYYLGPGLKMLLPWVLLLPWVAVDTWRAVQSARPRDGKEDRLQSLLHWVRHLCVQPAPNLAIPLIVVSLFVVFSAVPSKRWHYLGPWYPLAVLALAAFLAQHKHRWLLRLAKAVIGLLVIGVPLFFGLIQPALRGWENPDLAFVRETIETVPDKSVLLSFSGNIEDFNFFGRQAHRLPEAWRLIHVAAAAPMESEDEGEVTAMRPAELPGLVRQATASGQTCYLAGNGRNLLEINKIMDQLEVREVLSRTVERDEKKRQHPEATWYLLQISPKS